ncbi:MAG: peptide-methionine (S)-S-oxide reductase MsrA [Halobacteriovoraceae bacterium]|nr:peptide-methionine (S)-S-oxide reductase MsrA [Halobacteriovoraceae bacterium]
MKTIYLIFLLVIMQGSWAMENKSQQQPILEVSILGGGCFWGVEELIRKLEGVKDTEVGYAGGDAQKKTYLDVKTGSTGHAEVVKVSFDPQKLKFEDLLRYFFRLHDPTTLNQQGNDKGSQYRSVIFYQSETQKRIAEKIIKEVNDSKKWSKPVVTKLEPYKNYFKAEEYHQDYLQKDPGGYTCHYLR